MMTSSQEHKLATLVLILMTLGFLLGFLMGRRSVQQEARSRNHGVLVPMCPGLYRFLWNDQVLTSLTVPKIRYVVMSTSWPDNIPPDSRAQLVRRLDELMSDNADPRKDTP